MGEKVITRFFLVYTCTFFCFWLGQCFSKIWFFRFISVWRIDFITSFSLANGLNEIRIGFVEGVWMVGKIDEVRISVTETDTNAILVETKTRMTDTPPAEPQQRNGRYANYSGFPFQSDWDERLLANASTKSWHSHFYWQAAIDVLQVFVGQFSSW
jgi:hypothetical protein